MVDLDWISDTKERRLFFKKEYNEFFDALEATGPTYNTLEECGIDFVVQMFPDYTPPEIKERNLKRYYEAVDALNKKGDEWNRMHPNEPCKMKSIK